MSIDIGGHVSSRFKVSGACYQFCCLPFCRATLSDCSASSPVVFLCPSYPLFCLLLLYFLTFLFLKCVMNLDCFFLYSFIVFFSLTCFRMSSLVILSVHGTFSILLQNHISVASRHFSTPLFIVQASLP